ARRSQHRRARPAVASPPRDAERPPGGRPPADPARERLCRDARRRRGDRRTRHVDRRATGQARADGRGVRRKHAPRELTAERIRDVALARIDRAGLDAFSTRKLGEALGCEAMAIYYYYPSKEALLDAVVDQMMAGVAAEVGTETADWVDAMRKVA